MSKKMLGMFGLYAAMAYAGESYNFKDKEVYNPEESPEEKQKRLEKSKVDNMKRQGLKEFFYQGKSIWALNQKSADRKAKNKGFI